jgi:alpha-mannosidase
VIDWESTGVSLKASFPFTAENENATYNLVVGTIERNTNHEKKYEVPSKMWFDLTDRSGEYGIAVLEDCKYGSDKPDDNTLRLTLLYTPSADKCHTWLYQATQDWGIQDVKYGLYSHAGKWPESEVQAQAEFLNKPLIAYEAPKHKGNLGKEFSFMKINSDNVGLMALKKAENSDHYIVRVNELSGTDLKGLSMSFPSEILEAYEVNGQEQKIGDVKTSGGKLNFDLSHYTIRSFAVKLAPQKEIETAQVQVELPFNEDAMSHDNNRSDGTFYKRPYDPTRHGNLYGYPAEEIPDEIVSDGITFKMGSRDDLQNNVVRCAGQEIELPEGDYNRLYILAAAYDDLSDDFIVDGKKVNIGIAKWHGYIGQHYDRQFEVDGYTVYDVKPPFVKDDNIAWFASHRHFAYPSANMPYEYSYIFKYEIDIEKGAKKIVLPDNSRIRVFAITLADDKGDKIEMLQPLHDDFSENPPYRLRPGKHVRLR